MRARLRNRDGVRPLQRRRQRRGVGLALRAPLRQFLHLQPADGGLRLGHARVGAETVHQPFEMRPGVARRGAVEVLAVVAIGPHFFEERRVVGDDHAAFAARTDDLVLAEGKATDVAETADGAAMHLGAVGLGAILDDLDVLRGGKSRQRGHVGGPARQMYDDHGLCARCQNLRHGFRRQVLGLWIDIRHHGPRAAQGNRCRRGDEGARRNNDLVAGADAERMQRDFQRYGAVGDGEAVPSFAMGGVFGLEGFAFAAGPVIDAAGAQDGGRGGDFVIRVKRPGREF